MYQLHSSLSNVLLGTMDTTADAAAISERYEAAGGDAERLLVLRGRDGIEALEGRADGSLMSRWTRQLYRACDTITAYIVDSAAEDLRNGSTVLVVRQVDSRVAVAEVNDSDEWAHPTCITPGAGPRSSTVRSRRPARHGRRPRSSTEETAVDRERTGTDGPPGCSSTTIRRFGAWTGSFGPGWTLAELMSLTHRSGHHRTTGSGE